MAAGASGGASSSAAGTANGLPHFGHLIFFPAGMLWPTRSLTLQEGQASFLISFIASPCTSHFGHLFGFAVGKLAQMRQHGMIPAKQELATEEASAAMPQPQWPTFGNPVSGFETDFFGA
jgi:hypothetical protein